MDLTKENAQRYADQGLTAKEISVKLKVSLATVENLLAGYTPQRLSAQTQEQDAEYKRLLLDAVVRKLPLFEIRGKAYCARYFDALPSLDAERYESLKASIMESGVIESDIIVDDSALPSILDGFHRAKIWHEAPADKKPIVGFKVRSGLDDEQKTTLAYQLNTERRQLTSEDLRATAIKIKREKQWSNPRIAALLGVNQATVWKWLQGVELPATVVDARGRTQPTQQAPKTQAPVSSPAGEHEVPRLLISTPEERAGISGPSLYDRAVRRREECTGVTETCQVSECGECAKRDCPQGSEWHYHHDGCGPCAEAEEEEERDSQRAARAPAIMASQREDHNTPEEILVPLRRFAPIALDPCSNRYSTVGATISITIEQDGLRADWVKLTQAHDHIFINPPYDKDTLELVHKRSRYAASCGRLVTTLVPVKSDQGWFQDLIEGGAAAICYVKGRVRFYSDGIQQQGAAFPVALVYYGPRSYDWAETVKSLGACSFVSFRSISFSEEIEEKGENK